LSLRFSLRSFRMISSRCRMSFSSLNSILSLASHSFDHMAFFFQKTYFYIFFDFCNKCEKFTRLFRFLF
jgi:hypothetical protein